MIERNILYNGMPAIWPLPNNCTWTGDHLSLPDAVTLSFDQPIAAEAELFMQSMAGQGVAVMQTDRGAIIRTTLAEDSRLSDQGYTLEVSHSGIQLQANAAAGIFYGFQTLAQLLVNSALRKIPCVSIMDSPFKQIRGAHFYVPSKQNLPWFKKFIDFLAKYKYNTIFLEMGASMRFDSHPEINKAWESFCKEMLVYPGGPDGNCWSDNGMQMLTGNIKDSVHIENGGGSYLEKSEITEIAELCRQRHIEIIPEVQGLSHSYWMLQAYPDCAERSDDPYPDTWCPSNLKTYEIYFDCLQEIVDVLHPKTVSLGHDEYNWIGFCNRCKEKTGHDIFTEDILKCYDWLKKRGIKTHVWGDKFLNFVKVDEAEIGMSTGGRQHLYYNQRTSTNEQLKATYRSIDMMPNDLLLSDWYYGVRDNTQDLFNDKGLTQIFGNFYPELFPDMEARLRRPNVIGAEVSLWHETSDLGMAMKDNFVTYLDAVNVLWFRKYKFKDRACYNRVVSQIYPVERDWMNGIAPASAVSGDFHFIDISSQYNSPLARNRDYSYIASQDRIPNAIPFDICHNVADIDRDAACLLVGGGEKECADIAVSGKFRSVAFLHSYTENLAGPPSRSCTYIGLEEDIVGCYLMEYIDGSIEKVNLEYSRNIFTNGSAHAFGAHWANPIYQSRIIQETVEQLATSSKVVLKESNFTIFGYEWYNPYPDKAIVRISINHNPQKPGGIVLFAITGIVC